jgi:hypothetical protein
LIRVIAPEPAFSPAVVSEVTTPAEVLQPATPKIITRGHVDWIYGLPAASLAGIVGAVFMVASQGQFGLGLLATGALAVSFYRRRTPNSNITLWMGIKLGLLSGLIGFVISAVFVGIVTLFTGTGRLRAFLIEIAKESEKWSGPESQKQVWEPMMTPQGFPNLLIFYLFVFLLAFLIFSSIGGALGALWVRFRRRP